MASESDIIQVDITVSQAGTPRAGYGMPMIPSHNAPWLDRLRLYSDASDAVTDGYASDSPEVLALSRIFMQTPKPPLVAIGRMTASVTQRYEIELAATGPRDAFLYQLEVVGEGFEGVTVEYESDDDATDDEILGGIVVALNAVDDKNFTAALVPGASDPSAIQVTGNAPGNWFSLRVIDRRALTLKQTHTVAGLADDLDAILNVSKAWYCVVPLYCSADYVGDIAAWTAARGRITVFDTCDTDVLEAYVSGTSTDVGATLLGLGYSGVCGMYASAPAKFAAAAWMGRWLPTLPGQTNPAFRFLEGVVAEDLTDTELANLVARRMNVYRAAFATAITWEGMVFSTQYRYLDVRRNVDWLRDEMVKGTFDIQVGSEGLGFDAPGIQALAGGPKQAMRLGEERGVLNPGWKVEVPDASTIPSNDKAQRKLSKIKASGSVRGFVNKVNPIQVSIGF